MATAKEYAQKALIFADAWIARLEEGKVKDSRLQVQTPQDVRGWLGVFLLAAEAAGIIREEEEWEQNQGRDPESWHISLSVPEPETPPLEPGGEKDGGHDDSCF